MGVENLPRTLEFVRDENDRPALRIIDQRCLPDELHRIDLIRYQQVVDAISQLAVRGAPALGVAGAAAVALWACNQTQYADVQSFERELAQVAQAVSRVRPTAVNLQWGVRQALDAARPALDADDAGAAAALMWARAQCLAADDEACNRAIGANGARLLASGSRVLTHCNAGSLATAFYGTALGVVYAGFEQGRVAHVYCDETRPVGQGARLTAWELAQAGVPCTLLCDDMAATLMRTGKVDAVVVGADRICANGDVANKIGTYALAIAADYHRIPFYVAAPTSTIDTALDDGAQVPIEFRDADEVATFERFHPDVYNPAFDITPAALVNGIITEKGVIRPILHEDGSLFDLRDLSRIAPL